MLPAMVLAAGLGTRLRPLTFEIPKPMVPVLDRPVMAHVVDLLRRHGVTDVVANLHWFPDTIEGYFGDEVTYRREETLLGTAGGVRNMRDLLGDDAFLVLSGDALTDADLTRLVERHRGSGGIATLCVKRVDETQEFGVVLHDEDGRITGFQEKPHPDEALSNLANCGMYVFSAEIFDYFPEGQDEVDWANDVFPRLLEHDVPFHVHVLEDEYWNDVGTLAELRQGTFDALTGGLHLPSLPGAGPQAVIVGEGSSLEAAEVVDGPVFLGRGVTVEAGARLQGPVVIGDGATIGAGSALKGSIVLPGTSVAPRTILADAILGQTGIAAALGTRPAG